MRFTRQKTIWNHGGVQVNCLSVLTYATSVKVENALYDKIARISRVVSQAWNLIKSPIAGIRHFNIRSESRPKRLVRRGETSCQSFQEPEKTATVHERVLNIFLVVDSFNNFHFLAMAARICDPTDGSALRNTLGWHLYEYLSQKWARLKECFARETRTTSRQCLLFRVTQCVGNEFSAKCLRCRSGCLSGKARVMFLRAVWYRTFLIVCRCMHGKKLVAVTRVSS